MANTFCRERIADIKKLYKHWDVCGISIDNHSKSYSLFHDYGTECCPDSDCHGDSSCGAAGILSLSVQDSNCYSDCNGDGLHGTAGGTW